jgi:hypothetical protein
MEGDTVSLFKALKSLIQNKSEAQDLSYYENLRAPLRTKADYDQATEEMKQSFSTYANPNKNSGVIISKFAGHSKYVWDGNTLSSYSSSKILEYDGKTIKKFGGNNIYTWKNNCLSEFAGRNLYSATNNSISEFAGKKLYSFDSNSISNFAGEKRYSFTGYVPPAILILIVEELI